MTGTLFDDGQTSLSTIAFPMYFIKKVNPKGTGALLNFSIGKARETALAKGLLPSEIGEAGEQHVLNTTDKIVYTLVQGIQSPVTLISLLPRWIRRTESKDVTKNID